MVERNFQSSGINKGIVPFTTGTAAFRHLFGGDGGGIFARVKGNKARECAALSVLTTTDDSQEIKRCYELGCNVYITKPVNYESFANAIRQLGLFFSVIQVPPAAT